MSGAAMLLRARQGVRASASAPPPPSPGTVIAAVEGFSLRRLRQGQSITVPMVYTRVDYSGTITASLATSLPSGVTLVGISPNGTSGDTATATFAAASDATLGAASVTLALSGDGLTSDGVTFTLDVREAVEIVRGFNAGPLDASAKSVPGDGFDDWAGNTVYTDEQVFEGDFAAKTRIDAMTTGTTTFGGLLNFPRLYRGETVWFEQYQWIPDDFVIDTFGGHLKFQRFQTFNNITDKNSGYLDLYLRDDDTQTPLTTYRWILEGQHIWHPAGPNARFPRDQWVRTTICFTLDSETVANGGLARVRHWENGTLLLDSTTLKTINQPDHYMRTHLTFTYWNNGDPPRTQSLYLDAMKFFVGDAPPAWATGLEGVTP